MRIQLELTEKQLGEIKSLMEETGMSSYKELFEEAVCLLEWAIRQKQEGRTVLTQKPGEIERELLMPVLQRAERARK